ncbi:3-dehydroquinate synthase [Hydrogenovibrio kuenenii]|uniref:3-dehydroquinate synthase n=1 Tax=Hydrogenovibrio kuenenii TaxID=63658 RepID=UPI00046707A3|nr:3-dehydroquinate synthase family protein [Hydrogenovibrio kuenenii]
MNTIAINSGEKNYEVTVLNQKSLQSEFDGIANKYRKLVILVDANIKALYPDIVDYEKYDYLVLDATEEQKSFHNLDLVFDFYQKIGMQKKDVVIALGGGIIQDIVSLTTKIYWRGIDHYLVPTTLLSMADSSIGAKCGINYRDKKNQIAVFYSPSGVIQNLEFLNTLKDEDIVSGVGEIVKLLITSSEEDFIFLENNILDALKDRSRFAELIIRSLLSKKAVIEEDEYESDLRRVLNYGHTLGHAVESLSNYAIPHGVAVLWGMDIMNYVAKQRGYMPETLYQRINHLIVSIYDISKITVGDYEKLLNLVKSDKKVEGSKINIVYPEALGRLVIKPIEIDNNFLQNIKEYYGE